jgi:predicted HicB family RNase H-like nuclease
MAKNGKRVKNEAENADGEVVVQLATRIPKTLQRRLKLYAVEQNVSISDFVSEAIEAHLDSAGATKRERKSKRAERAEAA